MTKKEKLKKFYKEHEETINTGAKIAAGLVIGLVVCKRIKKAFSTISYTPRPQEIKIPETTAYTKPVLPRVLDSAGYTVENWSPRYVEIWNWAATDKAMPTIEQLHDQVEALRDIKGFTENTRIQAMFNLNLND